jgi:hypothetical protein
MDGGYVSRFATGRLSARPRSPDVISRTSSETDRHCSRFTQGDPFAHSGYLRHDQFRVLTVSDLGL